MSAYSDKNNKNKLVSTVICAILMCVLIVTTFSSCSLFGSGKDVIDSGVTIGELSLGGKTEAEAVSLLKNSFKAEDVIIKLDCDGTVFDIYGSSVGLKIDYEATAKKAVSIGKDASFFKKLFKSDKDTEELNLVILCDYNVLQYTINENLGDKIEDVQQHSVQIGENELLVHNGKSGRIVSAQKLIDHVAKAIVDGTISETIELHIEDASPEPINADKFLEEYNRDPQDATVEQKGDEVKITPEVIGVKINEEETKKILSENADSSEIYSIPAEISYPKVTAVELEAEYTDTLIGSYSTDYSTSSANRKTNISLASSKINGFILNPGQVFSFNDIVGPRTAATGYKVAHVYSGNKVVDGIGGGICQVSSTLYNAVVFADLEIVYRTNHSIPVSYVPLGRDATVSYGSIDFKFKNNKESPVKFEVIADGTNLTVNVYGRKKYVKDISIETAIIGYVPFSTETIEDPALAEGETVVSEAGSNGTRVEAYKVVKENGTVVSRTFLAKSNYSPTTQVVRVGTMPSEGTEEGVEGVEGEIPGNIEVVPGSGSISNLPPNVPADPSVVVPPEVSAGADIGNTAPAVPQVSPAQTSPEAPEQTAPVPSVAPTDAAPAPAAPAPAAPAPAVPAPAVPAPAVNATY